MILSYPIRRSVNRSALCKYFFSSTYSTHSPTNTNHSSSNSKHKHYEKNSPVAHWFYATDTPISKSTFKAWKPLTAAAKFTAFSDHDSNKLESAFQHTMAQKHHSTTSNEHNHNNSNEVSMKNTTKHHKHAKSSVSVLEDQLYEVDVAARTLSPIYWDGPVYEVRRGTWFIRDNSKNDPIPEHLAEEIEALYQYCRQDPSSSPNKNLLKDQLLSPEAIEAAKPMQDKNTSLLSDLIDIKDSEIFALTTPVDKENVVKAVSKVYYPKLQIEDKPASTPESKTSSSSITDIFSPVQTKRKFVKFDLSEIHEKSNSNSNPEIAAYILSGDIPSIIARQLASLGGTKITRGYQELKSPKDFDASKTLKKLLADNDEPAESNGSSENDASSNNNSLLSTSDRDTRDRSVDHLVICIHGIGQKLSERVELVNFESDINVFRTQLKKVFLESPDIQKEAAEYILNNYGAKSVEEGIERAKNAKNSASNETHKSHTKTKKSGLALAMESAKHLLEKSQEGEGAATSNGGAEKGNAESKPTKIADHRVQVIPLIWRHNIQFGITRQDVDANKHKMKKKMKEEAGSEERSGKEIKDGDGEYLGPVNEVSLEDINVNGILPVRNVVGDVVLDVLLYYQPQYHQQIFNSVVKQLNTVYHEFCKRNPNFAKNPQVSIMGHSLGSAIAFDIICAQTQRKEAESLSKSESKGKSKSELDFDVDIFFGVGSPVGMFQLLKGNKLVSPEQLTKSLKACQEGDKKSNPKSIHKMDPLTSFTTPPSLLPSSSSENAHIVGLVSPGVKAYYNIFHPCDPIAYRVDPLVDRDAASLPAKKVPYTQGSLPSQIQKFQDLAAKFSQDASSLWTNMAGTLLDTSNKGAGKVFNNNSVLSGILALGKSESQKSKKNGSLSNNNSNDNNSHYGSEKKEGSVAENKTEDSKSLPISERLPFSELPPERQAEVLEKLAQFNYTGQIDYALQEGVLDISLFAALASHVSYFENADLASFVLKAIYNLRKAGTEKAQK